MRGVEEMAEIKSMRRECRLALGQVADGRGRRVLCLDRAGGQEQGGRAAHRQRTWRAQRSADPGRHFTKRGGRGFTEGWTCLQGGPLAQAAAKDLIRAVDSRPINDNLVDDTAHRIAHLRATPEAREGISAFLDKRQANWIGE